MIEKCKADFRNRHGQLNAFIKSVITDLRRFQRGLFYQHKSNTNNNKDEKLYFPIRLRKINKKKYIYIYTACT